MAPILDIEVECGEQKSRLFRGIVVLRGTVNYCSGWDRFPPFIDDAERLCGTICQFLVGFAQSWFVPLMPGAPGRSILSVQNALPFGDPTSLSSQMMAIQEITSR